MNARAKAQEWLAEGDAPEIVVPRMVHDVLAADEERLPVLLRAVTYMTEALMARQSAAILVQALAERRFLPHEGEGHAALREEVEASAESRAAAGDRLAERRAALRRTEEQIAGLTAEVARLRAVLAALPGEEGE